MNNKIKNFKIKIKEIKMRLFKNILALSLAIISINACSSATSPEGEKDNSLKANLTSSGKLAVENEADALVIKQTDNTDDTYITSVKTGNNEYTATVKSEVKGYEVVMIFENYSLFPSKITIKNGEESLSGDILNYNEAEKTFDISWKEADGTEVFVFEGVKLKGEVNNSKYQNSDEETYQLKTMVNSSIVSDSVNTYIDENPIMARSWWKKLLRALSIVAVIVLGIFTGGTGIIFF